MIYLPENYYFGNNQDFPFQKGVLVTAKTVARWCDSYEAEIIEPKRGIEVKHKSGDLPKNINDKEKTVEDILNWIWENSIGVKTFCLYLKKKNKDDKPINVFIHHDDNCCWGLELSEDEFAELQRVLKKNNLPEDLFFKKDQSIIVIPKYYEKWSKLRKILFGHKHIFSPKTWEEMKKEGEDQEYITNKKIISSDYKYL